MYERKSFNETEYKVGCRDVQAQRWKATAWTGSEEETGQYSHVL